MDQFSIGLQLELMLSVKSSRNCEIEQDHYSCECADLAEVWENGWVGDGNDGVVATVGDDFGGGGGGLQGSTGGFGSSSRFLDKRRMMGMVVVLLMLATICNGDENNMKYEEAKGKAAEVGEAGKESAESWTGWSKDKILEGLGLRTKEPKDASKDNIVGTGERAAEKTLEMKKSAEYQGAKEGAGSIKDKAQNAKQGAEEGVGYQNGHSLDQTNHHDQH
ncbi:hypothetical protein L6452_05707 [Arctium lappa]|uniref:Uncharacterized protein n=1 Tax=Arctium lappa TaxID=4217 RepID=A0ACB9EHF5_ARCLA|nr:hypothetical protein L6452_05707 [Arctium lappa]